MSGHFVKWHKEKTSRVGFCRRLLLLCKKGQRMTFIVQVGDSVPVEPDVSWLCSQVLDSPFPLSYSCGRISQVPTCFRRSPDHNVD